MGVNAPGARTANHTTQGIFQNAGNQPPQVKTLTKQCTAEDVTKHDTTTHTTETTTTGSALVACEPPRSQALWHSP